MIELNILNFVAVILYMIAARMLEAGLKWYVTAQTTRQAPSDGQYA
jgi:hypothetical protein